MSPVFGQQLSRAEIELMKQTRICDLSSRGLTALPPEIGQLTNLQWLELEDNQLTGLPPEFGQLANLQTLALEATS